MIEKSDESNEEIKETIVQNTIMEYIKETGNSEIGEKGKKDIAKRVMNKILPEDTRQTIEVIDLIRDDQSPKPKTIDSMAENSGVNNLLKKNIKKVKKVSQRELSLQTSNMNKKKLKKRIVTSETNKSKDILEEALYTGETDKVDNAMLDVLFANLTIASEQNKEVNKIDVNKKSKKKVSNYEIEDKLQYYLEKSKSGNGSNSNSDGELDTRQKSKELNTMLYGPVTDIIGLINSNGKNY